MVKLLKCLLSLLLLCQITIAQDSKFLNKTEGLEISPPIRLENPVSEIKIEAKSSGSVKWLVVANKNIKYDEDQKNKLIIIKNPAAANTIDIFAVSSVSGKLTDFVSTKITNNIKKKDNTPISKKLDVTIYVDYTKLTAEQNKIINIPYSDFTQQYDYASFQTFDINAYKKNNNLGTAVLIIKNGEQEVFFGPLPKDLKTFVDLLETLKPKGN